MTECIKKFMIFKYIQLESLRSINIFYSMQNHRQPKLPIEHTFDFKVKVNYQQGNVAIVGPNQYTPVRPQINYIQNPQNSMTSSQTSQAYKIENPQQINCVICQKSYEPSEFQRHLEFHRNGPSTTKLSNQTENSIHQSSFSKHSQQSQPVQSQNYSFQNPVQFSKTNSQYSQKNQPIVHQPPPSIHSHSSYSQPQQAVMRSQQVSDKNSFLNSNQESSFQRQAIQEGCFINSSSYISQHIPQQAYEKSQHKMSTNSKQRVSRVDSKLQFQPPQEQFSRRQMNPFQKKPLEENYFVQPNSYRSEPHGEILQHNQQRYNNVESRQRQMKPQYEVNSSQQQFSQRNGQAPKKSQSFQFSLLRYQLDSNGSDQEDQGPLKTKQPLENLSRDDILKMYHNSSGMNYQQSSINIDESFVSKNSSFSINDYMVKGVQSRHILRGVQANEPSIINQSKMSSASISSSKVKLPKNYFARNDMIETMSIVKSQKR